MKTRSSSLLCRRPALLASALALTFALATPMQAQTTNTANTANPARETRSSIPGLDLSQSQRDRIFEVRHAAAPELRQAQQERLAARQALRELRAAPVFDEAQAKAAAGREGAAVARAALLQARVDSQTRAVLTPEQRDALKTGLQSPREFGQGHNRNHVRKNRDHVRQKSTRQSHKRDSRNVRPSRDSRRHRS